jgi:hypothetical protein
VAKISSEVEMSAISLRKLQQQHLQHQQQQQQQPQQRSSSNSKPPLFSAGLDDRTQKEREDFLNRPVDMATYWHIAEEEGLDESEGEPEEAIELQEEDEEDHLPTMEIQSLVSQLVPPLPHIPSPDVASPAEPATSHSSLQSQIDADDSVDGLSISSQSQVNDPSAVARRSISSAPSEPPSSSRRPSNRPSFMRARRKISAINSISQPGEPSAPPIKARTSIVRTIAKADSVSAQGTSLTLIQFQDFRQERLTAESNLSNRLKAMEKTVPQMNTLREAVQILSEEIRVISEELTGGIKKEIAELKDGQLNSFQEIFKVIENCFHQIKRLQTTQAQFKQKNASFGMESVQQELRILQQNMEVYLSLCLDLSPAADRHASPSSLS